MTYHLAPEDAWPVPPPDSPRDLFPLGPDELEEIEAPKCIFLKAPENEEPYLARSWTLGKVGRMLDAAGFSGDKLWLLGLPHRFPLIVTKQAEDCFYAGIPQDRTLTLWRL